MRREAGIFTDRSHLDGSYDMSGRGPPAQRGVEERDAGILERVLSRVRTMPNQQDPRPPPDGGWSGWSQGIYSTFVVHLVMMNTWGFINSFGVFQTYYATALNRPPSDISWIGSMQVFLLFFIGTFTGRLTDAGYFRPVFLTGSFLGVLGLFMRVCCGLGNGFLFCPSMSLLSTYFTKNKSLAIGISAAGSATGGMLFPAIVQQMLGKVGFPWTMRTLGLVQLASFIVCNIGIKPRLPPRETGTLIDWKSFKEATYVLFAAGMFFNFWGVYFAYFYLGSFARSIVGLEYADSVNLLIVLNGVGVLGHTLPNFLADRYFGALNTLIPIILVTSGLSFAWMGITATSGLYTWTVMFGIIAAAIQSLFPATLGSLTTDVSMAGTRMGMVFSIVSFAVLTGPPIAGQLIQLKGGEYEYAQVFSGASLLVGCILLCAARWMQK
ncbi:major facilitator superfamily domain-containing protein [Leptodontidium sp. 2 PMI_412]|nr:major facilitator superfamily domain-containing protein [Leptodontidium sp. 2 PMI_412]